MKTRSQIIAATLLIAMAGSTTLMAQEWTRFRGPNGTGISESSASIPAEWSENNIKWKVPVPGTAHSSPVLWGNKLFLSTVSDNGSQQVLICFNAESGKPIWQKKFQAPAYRVHRFNSLASSSAAVTESQVFFTWGTPDSIYLTALDHSGEQLWQKPLGTFESQHGFGNSPIVIGNKVIVANDQLGVSYLAAFNTENGDQIWRVERKSGTKTAYSAPSLFTPEKGEPYLIFNSSSHGITGVNPDTGAVIWEKGGLFDKRSVSSSVFSKNLIFGSCGSGGGGNYVVAISAPNDTSKITTPKLVHKFRRSAPYVPTPLVVGDRVYFWSDQGIVSCIDLTNGDTVYSERTNKRFFGSPIMADGKMFCVATDGTVVVVKVSDEFEMLAMNPLKEISNSTPAVANGKLFVRTSGHLFCIGE